MNAPLSLVLFLISYMCQDLYFEIIYELFSINLCLFHKLMSILDLHLNLLLIEHKNHLEIHSSPLNLVFNSFFVVHLDDTHHEEELPNEDDENAAKRRRTCKLPKCLDGKYFTIENWKSDVNLEAKCMLCQHDAKSIGAAINGTANLSRHIKLFHEEELESFNRHINNKKNMKVIDQITTKAEHSKNMVSNSINAKV